LVGLGEQVADVLGELWVDVLDNTGVAADEPAAKKIELKRGCGPYSLVKIKGETFQVAFENRIGQKEFVLLQRQRGSLKISSRGLVTVD
jgi:hypothetical protein